MNATNLEQFNLSTRRKRRRAMAFVIALPGRMASAEEVFTWRVPESLKCGEAAMNAEMSIDCILEAIDLLMGAY